MKHKSASPAATHPASDGTSRVVSAFDRFLALICVRCPVCRHARRKQRGLAFQLVNQVERHLCPFCRAYHRVYGRKASTPSAASIP